ncbi:MAG: hypothetical protein Q9190_002172 [Brigantiaea leucoxantha]
MLSRRTSQASTMVGSDSSQSQTDFKSSPSSNLQRAKETATSQDILLFLVAFRILNALSVKTFFQPDEYFQSLEPAWQIAFGAESGAWITWEWKNRLRSAVHPTIFAGVYRLVSTLSPAMHLSPHSHAELLIAAPKVVQAICAALGDYYTWKLSGRLYGSRSNEAWATTTLTVIALSLWPWHWSITAESEDHTDEYGLRIDEKHEQATELAKWD